MFNMQNKTENKQDPIFYKLKSNMSSEICCPCLTYIMNKEKGWRKKRKTEMTETYTLSNSNEGCIIIINTISQSGILHASFPIFN